MTSKEAWSKQVQVRMRLVHYIAPSTAFYFQASPAKSPYTGVSQFLATSQKIFQFMEGNLKEPKVELFFFYLSLK